MTKQEIKKRDMELLYDYRMKLQKNPRLRFLFLELTDKCNMACRHCGSRCSAGNERFLDTELILRHLDEIAEDFKNQPFMFCITGGEPLLHPDFDAIVSKINELDIAWGMTSNGILIDEAMAYKLRDLEMSSISLSLDGLKENHEWLRQVPGSFDMTIDAVNNLHNAGHKVQITTVVNKHNIDELEDIYRLMRALGVYSWKVINVDPIGRAEDSDNLSLDDKEMLRMLKFIREKRYDNDNPMDVSYGCSHYLSYELEREVRDFYFQCIAGTQIMSITCDGDIYACLDIERRPELVQGNIRTDRVSDVWYNGFKEFRTDHVQLCEKCVQCEERRYCGGESWHTWDFDKNEPKICLVDSIHREVQ